MADPAKESSVLELIKSYARGVLKGNTADTLGAPVDLINELIVRPVASILGAGDKVSDKPVGGGKYFREKFGQAVEDANPAETVGSMISAGGAAKTAIILPAFLTKSIKDIKTAERALEKGISGDKVYETLGVFKLPENIDDGVMRSVIDDRNMKVNVYGGNTLGSVMDHPELFKAVPDLKDVKVRFGDGRLKMNNAYHSAEENLIVLGPQMDLIERDKSLLHEIQHAIQSRFSMNAGASPSNFFADPEKYAKAKTFAAESGASLEYDMLNSTQQRATEKYKTVAGEAESRAVEKMYREQAPKFSSPISYYGGAYDLDRMIVSPEYATKVDEEPGTKALIARMLKQAEADKSSKKAP